jgi:hypothetical protein
MHPGGVSTHPRIDHLTYNSITYEGTSHGNRATDPSSSTNLLSGANAVTWCRGPPTQRFVFYVP